MTSASASRGEIVSYTKNWFLRGKLPRNMVKVTGFHIETEILWQCHEIVITKNETLCL